MQSALMRLLPLTVLLWTAAAAADDFLPQAALAVPIHIRFEGYVGEKPAQLVPEASWVLETRGKKYPFHVSHLQIITGDVSPTNIIEAVKPYRVTFRLRGDDARLQQFTGTAPGQKIAAGTDGSSASAGSVASPGPSSASAPPCWSPCSMFMSAPAQ